jgi:catechol 2,3-dioxygenase-like lactoylglutathione lyase family enzyme
MAESKFHAVTPILQVENLQRGIEFYTTVLGLKLAWTWGEPPDRASFCRDTVEITIEEKKLGEAVRLTHLYLQVGEIDEYVEAISAAGARVKVPLADRVYGMRDCRVLDVDGNEISIGEPIVKTRDSAAPQHGPATFRG